MNRSRRTLNHQRYFVSAGFQDSRMQMHNHNSNKQISAPPPPRISESNKTDDITQYMNPEPPVVDEIEPIEVQQSGINKETSTAQKSPQNIQEEKSPHVSPVENESVIKDETDASHNEKTESNEYYAINNDDASDPEGKERKGYFKKIFGIRKKPSIRAKEKKLRQNRRLRKVLLPKNALMALHEVKNIKIEDFIINSNITGGFAATVIVNNVQYEGYGNSKNSAKNSACEKALRDLVISKMNQKLSELQQKTQPQQSGNEVIKTEENDANTSTTTDEDIQMKDIDDGDEDDVPMLNLASFALYKLFSEWEHEGFEIPEFRPSAGIGNGTECKLTPVDKPKKQPNVRTELPPNWESMHPATLLCMMRPGILYVNEGAEGIPPKTVQKIGLTIDNEYFNGVGRSKKIARRNAAVNACNRLYGTNFVQLEN